MYLRLLLSLCRVIFLKKNVSAGCARFAESPMFQKYLYNAYCVNLMFYIVRMCLSMLVSQRNRVIQWHVKCSLESLRQLRICWYVALFRSFRPAPVVDQAPMFFLDVQQRKSTCHTPWWDSVDCSCVPNAVFLATSGGRNLVAKPFALPVKIFYFFFLVI